MTSPHPRAETPPESDSGQGEHHRGGRGQEADDATPFVGVSPVPPRWVEDESPLLTPVLHELSGLRSAATAPVGVPRTQPWQERPSRLVARYLFPTERYRGEWRRHLIHLAAPVSAGVGATVGLLVLLGLAEPAREHLDAEIGLTAIASLSVLLWLGILAWIGWQVALWRFDRFVLTNKRVMAISGIVTREVAMMPLLRVTDMKYEQSVLSRILNYGTFVLESAGQDQALRKIHHLPNPNDLYLRVVEEMYEPERLAAGSTAADGGTHFGQAGSDA